MNKMSAHKILTDDEIEYIAGQSGVETDVIKTWHKDFLTACPKGKMVFNCLITKLVFESVFSNFFTCSFKDKKQFYKYYKMLRCQSDEKLSKITDHVFSCFDKDLNGYLDFSEFLIAYSSTSIGDPVKKLEFVFTFYDKDRDGIIKENEFLQVIQSMYEFRGKNKKDYPPEKCVRDIFERIDKNGDNKLTKDEFIEGCLKNKHILDLVSPFDI